MSMLLTDPAFYAAAIPAVILVGLSKGGLGGAMGFVGVPLMALVMSPVQAAAILLSMLPGAMLGIGIGWLTAAMVTADMVRLIVGVVAIVFVGRWVWQQWRHGSEHHATRSTPLAAFWGTVAGFTSFVAHVGGPPYQVYTLPLRLDPKVFTGTSVIFFAVTNAVKLIPYAALGQFDAANLTASLVLLPLAPLATLAGAWVVRRLKPDTFYLITYLTVAVIAVKLIWDGIGDVLAG